MSARRNLFLGLLIGLVLGGALSAFLSVHGLTSAQDSRVVLLRQGWNQLVWTANNQPADTALAAIAGDLVIVYGWQGDSQTFSRYIPGRTDISTMGQVEKNSGYWLLMTREVAFSVPTPDIQCPACPAPTLCPQCPEPSDVEVECVEFMLSHACTGVKLTMELEELVGDDLGSNKQFFNQNCQGVELKGSRLGDACALAGMLKGMIYCPANLTPEARTAVQRATVLIERYCTP